jgi:glutaryl-CoA dehydrogenase (non-decarboxylating)
MMQDEHNALTIAKELEARWGYAAASWDTEQRLPQEAFAWCAERGLFSVGLPEIYGGAGWSISAVGRLFESLGAVSGSLGSVINVHHMVTRAILCWGNAAQCERWLSGLASGAIRAAFCLTEPHAGSDLTAISTRSEADGDRMRLSGTKTWITTADTADLFLVLAQHTGASTVYLVERGTPDVRIEPSRDLLGLRAASVGVVHFDRCEVARDAQLVGDGFGLMLVASEGLLHGRLNLAWMACGLLRAATSRLAAWSSTRRVFGHLLAELGQPRQALARMNVDLRAARALCEAASDAVQRGTSGMTDAVLVAKYFACRAAAEHSGTAVRLHGASGCHEPNDLPRFYRDAKVFEIIEGSTEVLETVLAAGAARELLS